MFEWKGGQEQAQSTGRLLQELQNNRFSHPSAPELRISVDVRVDLNYMQRILYMCIVNAGGNILNYALSQKYE